MRPHEVADFVLANSDILRAYPWREVEKMREDLATCGMALSRHQAKMIRLKASIDKIKAGQEAARKAKDYETADALRDIIALLQSRY